MSLPSTFLLLVYFLHLIFFLSSINAHTSKVHCIEKEKQALLDFKLSFVADLFGVLSTWSIDVEGDCCTWDGVTCANSTGHVTSLRLGGGLKGYKLRPSLLELQHLTELSLNGNLFAMRIPAFIGSLSKLTYLDLSLAGFFGEIPPHLGNLSMLQSLDLGSNSLYADNLKWLSHLSSLEDLDLSNVDLSNAADWASTFKMLPTLSSFSCDSCSLPPPPLSSISHVNFSTSLYYLDLSNNSVSYLTFSSLIDGANDLRYLHLDYMKLEHSNLHELLGAIMDRNSLVELSLIGNNLNKLPFKVMEFPSLTFFGASSNKINGRLSEILQYLPTNLTTLYLSSNMLNDVISDAHFSNFVQLQDLDLSYNTFLTFNFSKSWVPPFQLHALNLRSCKIGPSFPDWILTHKKLSELDISNSMISGAIPDAFWDFSQRLFSLNLSNNKIHCDIPNLSLSFANLDELDLSSNTFHGPIPSFMFTANTLDLSNNKFSCFSSVHPAAFSDDSMLINLSSNRLSGMLPNWLFQFKKLSILNLENNKLSGTLPEEIGSLWQLTILHLSNNRFSGQLPLSMRNCSQLQILELANNKLSGVVQTWLGESMPKLIVLTLRSNIFSGDLPSSLCHLQSLQILDLSDNRLSGMIPGCLHNFSSMATNKELQLSDANGHQLSYLYTIQYPIVLDFASVMWKGGLADLYGRSLEQRNVINLSGNWLRGEIPIGVTTLKGLRSLDLSRNYLNGSIPDKIGQLTLLEVLKLSSNRLQGHIPESLADLTFLTTLNLSNNDLSGKIPTSTQLQSLDASSYAGNPNLCGLPLPKCLGDEDDKKPPPFTSEVHDGDDESFDIQAFLAALGMGFAFSFLGILGILHFNRRFRLAFFQLVHNIADRIFVTTSLYKSIIKRSLNLP